MMNAMNITTLKVTDFSKSPWGRHRTDTKYCGEIFRDEHLIPALLENDQVCVDFEGVEGCGSSFLEEAFGGLRSKGFSQKDIENKLILKFNSTFKHRIYKTKVESYIKKSFMQQ